MFDWPKTIALAWDRSGTVTAWNPTFASVALDLGIGIELCWPHSPEQKGSVENLVGQSGKAMARTGLRMMPTFPSPPLKFRTAGFPQSGFKASLSGRAFPDGSGLKPAPGIHPSPFGLHRPFARFRNGHADPARCPDPAVFPRAAVDLVSTVSGAHESVAAQGNAGPALDAQAKAAYRRRLAELREEVEEAERFNDPGRAVRAREEIDALTDQLAAGVGLGGRDRVTGTAAERARSTVTQRIRSALEKIGDALPALGDQLVPRIKTGVFCAYLPDTVHPIVWTF